MHAGIAPPQPAPPGAGTPTGAGTPQQMATVSDGTHPTGMHSCSHISSLELKTNMSKIYTIFKISFANVRCFIAEFIKNGKMVVLAVSIYTGFWSE